MNKIDGYSAYQSYFESSLQTKSAKDTQDAKKSSSTTGTDSKNQVERNSKADSKNQVELSDAAQKLLDELKEKYSNMDFIIADYSSDEEAQQLLSRGTKEYSVLIDPETLEKMAADEDVKAQYLGILDDSTSQLDEMKDQLEESGQEVKRIGFTIDDNGQVSYFAELEKSSKAQSERIEAAREQKRAEKKEAEAKAKEKAEEEAKAEKKEEAAEARKKERAGELYGGTSDGVKRTTVTASTTEELLEKIQNVDWDSVPELASRKAGEKFDFSV